MCIAIKSNSVAAEQLEARFLNIIRPAVERHARIAFRDTRNRDRRTDMEAEAVALAWKWHCRLAQRGKDACQWPTALAELVCRAVRSGRRLAGQAKSKDTLNEYAQHRFGFNVESLPISTAKGQQRLYGDPNGQREQDTFEERLRDDSKTPVPDQVAFRCDFPSWLRTRTERDRAIIADMGLNETTGNLSRKFGISRGRVSQLRREYHDDWTHYIDELPPREALAASVA